jgi:hypothetical protein
MGLFLRYNLFYRVSPEAVYDEYVRFYEERGQSLLHDGLDSSKAYELHRRDGDWTVLQWNIGWEWVVRREAQFHVSRELNCPGLLVFVYDSDYWAYEFFRDGVALDCFVQSPDEAGRWFSGKSCRGDAAIIAEHLPFLRRDILERYLVHWPRRDELKEGWQRVLLEQLKAWDVKPQPSDQFTRGKAATVFDFLRYLGVRMEVDDNWFVTFQAPVWARFWVGAEYRSVLHAARPLGDRE